MKTSLLTTLSFLLLLSSMKILLAHPDSDEPVVDIYNNTVNSNLYYVIKEATSGSNNALSNHNAFAVPCPFNVVRKPYEDATLAIFSPQDGSTTVIESKNVIVTYLFQNLYCQENEYPIWKVSDAGISSTQYPILVSVFDSKSSETWFSIERVRVTGGQVVYKFVHCPPVSGSESEICYNLALYWVDGAYRLYLDKGIGRAFQFVLVPVSSGRIKLPTSS